MAKNKKKKNTRQDLENKFGNGIAPISTKKTSAKTKKNTKKSTKKVDTMEETKKNKNVDTKPIAPVEIKKDDKFTIKTPEIQRTQEQEEAYNKKKSQATLNGQYIGKKAVSGVTTGLTGLVDAPIQTFQEGVEQGKGSSAAKNIIKGYVKSIDYLGLTNIPENAKELSEIATNDKLKTGQKIVKSGLAILNNNPVVQMIEGSGRLFKGLDKNAEKHVEKARKVVEKPSEKVSEWAEKDADKVDKWAKTVGGGAEVTTNMIPSIAASIITQNPNVGLAVMGVSAKGTSTREAEKKGATLSEANDIGFAKGAIEVLTEKMFSGFGKVFGKGALDDVAKEGLNRIIKNKGANYVAKRGMDILGEWFEETVSDLVDTYIDKNTTDPDATYTFKDWLETGKMTALSTIMLNGITGGYMPSTVIENNTELEKASQSENIQKIIEKELEERLNAEYNGKATAREIAQLQKEVIEDIQKGYISTDTIEKTLGGETYNKLDSINQERNKIQEQINELEQKAKNNELSSLEEKQKLNDLKEQIKTIDDSEIRNRLNQEIQETIKNDIGLQESYKEVGRRTENYNVDLNSIQDEKQRAVYQKAMESGVLNNSNKTHALVDMIAKISSEKGINFDFTNNEQLEKSGFGVNGRNINGYVTDSGITINLNSSKAINRIVGHELTHTFEGTTLYTELQNSLKDFLGSEWDNQFNKYKELYKGVKNANIENELTSDLIGDYLFTDENYVKNLSTKNKNLFEKIYDEIKYLYNVATAGSKEKRQLEKVKRTFDRIYNETESKVTNEDAKLSVEENAKYSISEDSQGRKLTENQKEYFKNSKVVDNNGNLKVLYNGSGNHTEYLPGYMSDESIWGKGIYLTPYKDIAEMYGNDVKETYVNIEKPIGSGKNLTFEQYNEFYKAINEGEEAYREEYDMYDNDFDLLWDTTNKGSWADYADELKEYTGYDGIIVDNPDAEASDQMVIAFKSNQVKNVSNETPTTNSDIRYSLSQDSQGNELSKQQQDYFKYSQARDENGNLEVVYHGSNSAGFTVFNRNYNYYTNNKDVSKTYTGSNEMVDTRKLESTYDAKSWLKNIISDAYIEGNKVYINGEEVLSYNSSEDLFKNLKRDIQEEFGDTKAGGIYEGYVNITNPLIVNCNGNKWSAIDINGIEGNLDSLFEEYGASTFEEDGATRTSTSDIASAVSDAVDEGALDYDGIIFKNIVDEGMYSNGTESGTVSNVYVTFNSNQFKAKDNLDPTKNRDIRYSLDIAPISKNFLTESEQDELDGLRAIDNSGWTELTPEEQRRMQQLENKADVVLNKKAEKMLRSASYKAINTSTKVAENYLDFDAKQKKDFRNQMREFSNMTKDELINAETYNKVKDIVNQYANREYTYFDDSVEGIKKELKHTKIKISDELKNQITDYGYFVRDSKLMLRRNSGTPVDQVYQEYSDMYPNFFSNEVWNEADQLEELNNFINHDFSVTEKYRLSDDDLRVATDLIYNKLLQNSLSMQDLIETEEILDKKVQKRTRAVVREELLNKMGITPELIQVGKDISAIDFARTDPIRVNEKVFGWKTGQLINDATVNFTKHQEAERMRFLNKERQEIKDLGIKARSKESELVQKYGEKQYVDKNNEVHPYTDAELNRDVKDVATREKIKNAARVLRQKYDTYIDRVNSVLTEMGYDEIPKRKDYMRHFVELDDKFSRWGLPFNKESMMAEDLPTDINGLTEFNRPGKSYFASANTRTGLQTTYDAITGIDGYLEGVSNLIYHTESIQRYRALTRFIRENYGREHGLDNIDLMTDEELAERIKDIQDNKLSKYVAWLDEQANSIAGKKGSLDRSVERMFGRRIYTALNTLKSQVGSNMTGFNVRSAMTNFASAIQGASKTKKLALVKGTISTINNIINNDGLIDKSDFLTRRLNASESLATKPWQKLSKVGQIFMEGTDYFTANQIWRSKYFENLDKGMSETQAIKNADDFAARIMGDRSKGSTAELFNSKTLGFLSQFQLEVNNQWSSLIHDNKIDIQKGNKTALGVTFELGQLFAASYMFNTMMKSLTGSDVMIDPIDMLLKIFKPKDDDKDEGIIKRAQKVLGEFINQLPFANLITGGGRIPISEAFTGVKTLGTKLMGGTDNYGNEISWGDVGEDLKESLAYWVLPTGYGQIRKTVKGLSMYDDELPIAGSYTDSGNLRFSAEDTPFGKIKAGLFGQYSSKYAQDYIDSGYKSINASKLDEMKDLDMNSTEYRDYREGLSAAGTSIEDKLNYISDLDVSDEDKTIMASNVAKKDIDMAEYKKFGSYDEFNYAQKNPAKYEVMKLVGGYDTYKNYEKAISEITADYDRNGKAISNSRKNKVIKYVNSLNLTRAQKAMLIKEQYPSFTQYDSQIASYINNQNMSFIQKAGILKQLGFKAYDRQIINYIKQNYRTVEEQQEELEKLGFKIYNYNGKTYVR